jgi:glycosyltransferase involved in cell wall biosynthesis
MIIAVNTRVLIRHKLEGYGYFVREVFRNLVLDHPEHQFYFLFDRPFEQEYVFAGNVIPLVLPPQARHPLLWKYWFDVQVPRILKKINADVFVSPDGYCSLSTKIPQCMVVHDLGFLHHPEAYKKSHLPYLKRNTPKFLKKAGSIATVSAFSKNDLVRQYGIAPEKISVVYSAVKDIFRPLPAGEQEAVKAQYTNGWDYFIYVGAIQPRKNVVSLLKAFSIFKKRQQSGMKLVLAGRMAWKNEDLLRLLQTYKYRDDLVMPDYLEEKELSRLVASAYALVYPSLFEGFGVPVLEGMQSGVPVLTSSHSAMEEIAGDAGLYFDPSDHQDIADKMMLLYKDEQLKNQLIQKGVVVAKNYSWKKTADLMWQAIMKAVEA